MFWCRFTPHRAFKCPRDDSRFKVKRTAAGDRRGVAHPDMLKREREEAPARNETSAAAPPPSSAGALQPETPSVQLAGVKRERAADADSSCSQHLTAGSSPQAMVAWLQGIGMSNIVDKVTEAGLSPAALLALTEDQMKTLLQMDRMIARRRLTMRLREARAASENQEPPAARPSQTPSTVVESLTVGTCGGHRPAAAAPVTAQQDNQTTVLLDQESVNTQLGAEADCIGSCQWSASKFQECLKAGRWASEGVVQSRLVELQRLSVKLTLPQMSIVVVGNTGAGKSTLLNSLLGEFA